MGIIEIIICTIGGVILGFTYYKLMKIIQEWK